MATTTIDNPLVESFRGDYAFLSNFYVAPIELAGVSWRTVEHFYQAMKSTNSKVQYAIRVLGSPQNAKRMGRTISLSPGWDLIRDIVMQEALQAKFDQHVDLRDKLIATGKKILIEGNSWHDNYWGACYCHKCTNTIGRNKLGSMLMHLRSEYSE